MKEESEKIYSKMGSFLEGFREGEAEIKLQREQGAIPSKQSEEILRSFKKAGVKAMTILEIASDVGITQGAAKMLSTELEDKKIVTVSGDEKIGYLVALTDEGEARLK